jgi:uncharacterized protein YbbC (DUF1343 family)
MSFLNLIILILCLSCTTNKGRSGPVITGCGQTRLYLKDLEGKSVGLVANHTTVIGNKHLADSLISMGVKLIRIFSPEHGFRGDADAGAGIRNSLDARTGVPVISLYGNKTKPSSEDLQGIDIMIYDIQDVGVRFYTYISTLHYVMEACAENHVPLIILDRPDPLGYYMDGPVLQPEYQSFVGMHPIPVVYALTPGELARMINGEKWLAGGIQCNLRVIPCLNYDHNTQYQLPVDPSPNLNSMEAIYLYPSLCFFEGTIMSLGRGTSFPFRVIGHPEYPDTSFSFVPRSGRSNLNPLLQDKTCYGIDLRSLTADSLKLQHAINLHWLIHAYVTMNKGKSFFTDYINLLAGTDSLRDQVVAGFTEKQIRESWQSRLNEFRKKRKAYLLYRDFSGQ